VLFDRVYRLLVGTKGQDKGLEITDLHISFDIQKTIKKNPNTSTIKVWNLKKDTRAQLEKPDTRIVLYAGYAEDAGPLMLFKGNVTYAWSKFDKADIITEFELGDGTQEMRDTTISVGYSTNIKSTSVLKDVSKQMGLPLTLPSNAPERVWKNGLSYHGPASGLLDKVTQGTGLEWSVQNGNLQVIQQGMVTTRQGIELALDSGLIYSPERIRKARHSAGGGSVLTGVTSTKAKKAKAKKEYEGWQVKSLLMPMINPGDRIKLTSRFVDGVFRVHEIKHTGDSHEGDWISEMKVVDPAAPIAGDSKTKGGIPSRSGAPEDDLEASDLMAVN
jgi:hypothetical protein